MLPIRAERFLLIVMILVRMLLAVGFSAVGTLEGPDEPGHFAYVRAVVTKGLLVNPYLITDPLGQYHQAPLYYWLAAPLAAWSGFGTDDQFRAILRFNDLGNTRLDLVSKDNQNYWLHDLTDRFPYPNNPIARAVHAVRLLSVLLGGLTVLFAYLAYSQLWPSDNQSTAQALRLMATGLIAFWPQLIFLSGVVNNDNLLFLLSTISIYLILRQLRAGWTWRNAIALGLTLGLALLTKVNGLLLVFPVGAAVLIRLGTKPARWRPLLGYPALTLLLTLIVSGWWYVRNLILYGDPFNFGALYVSWGGRPIAGTATGGALGYAIRGLPGVYQTWWARFGYTGMLRVSDGILTFFAVLSVLGIAGLLILAIAALLRHRPLFATPLIRSQALIFTIWLIALFVGLLYYSGREIQGNQARYMFPGLVALGAALVIGLRVFLRRRWLPVASALLTISILAISAVSLVDYYWPAFRPSGLPPTIDQPLAYQFGNPPVAELIGVSTLPHVIPGSTMRVTLYWRALSSVDHDLTVYLHSVGSQVVFRNSYPGAGTFLSTDWQPGDSWSETYTITIPADSPSQTTFPLVAGLTDQRTKTDLPVYSVADRSSTPLIGQLAINTPPESLPTPAYRLGNSIGLLAPIVTTQRDRIQICLDWLSLATPTHDEHVFVHLVDANQRLLAQADSPPLAGHYPTLAWGPGEQIHDCITLASSAIEPGRQISIGMYDPISGTRLTILDSAGYPLANSEIVLPVPLTDQ